MLEDPRHDRREGAPLRPVKAKRDYTKCTQRPDGVYISERISPPPKTGGDLEQTHRIETTIQGRSDNSHQDQHLLAFKDECTLCERELSQGMNSSRDAPVEKASEDGCEDQSPTQRQVTEDHPSKKCLERQLSTTDMKVTTQDRDGNTMSATVSMETPKHIAVCEDTRPSASLVTTTPRM